MPNKTLAKHMESFIDKALKAEKDANPYFDINGAAGRVFAQRMQSAQFGDLVKGGLPITKQKNSFFNMSNQLTNDHQQIKAEAMERSIENAKRRGSRSSCEDQSLIVIDNESSVNGGNSGMKRRSAVDDEEHRVVDTSSATESTGQQCASAAGSPEYYSRNNMNLLTQAMDAVSGHQSSLLNRSSGNESPSPAPSPSSSPFSTLSSVSSSSVKRLRRNSDCDETKLSNEQSIQRLELSKTPTNSIEVNEMTDDLSTGEKSAVEWSCGD